MSHLRYALIVNKPHILRILTGLSKQEFEHLVPPLPRLMRLIWRSWTACGGNRGNGGEVVDVTGLSCG